MIKTPVRKKRKGKQIKPSPFPVPIQSITGIGVNEKNWLCYTGDLHGHIIAVRSSGDMNYLYKMGFFGKGNLSRGEPEYNNHYKYTSIILQNTELYPRIVNKQWYKNHLSWVEGKEGYSSSEEEDCINDNDGTNATKTHIDLDCDTVENSDLASDNTKYDSMDSLGSLNQEPSLSTSLSTWNNTEGNAEFWNTNPTDSWDNTCGDENFWSISSSTAQSFGDLGKNNVQNLTERASNACDKQPNSNLNSDLEHKNDSKNKYVLHDQNDDLDCVPIKKLKLENKKENRSDIRANQCAYDNLSLNNDMDGDLFVIPDKTYMKNRNLKNKQWKPSLKKNPFPIKEYLQLSFVEAFFLSYGLGCLVVKELEKVLDIAAMWRIFCQRQQNFVPSYICYHYFRSKGWVPKSGLKFGCDFILYKVGPPFYHGSYSVIIQYVEEGSLKPVDGFAQRKITWRSLSGLNRITEHVGKEVMLLYVIKPKSIDGEADSFSSTFLSQFKVKEILLSRWISSQERQTKDVEDIP